MHRDTEHSFHKNDNQPSILPNTHVHTVFFIWQEGKSLMRSNIELSLCAVE